VDIISIFGKQQSNHFLLGTCGTILGFLPFIIYFIIGIFLSKRLLIPLPPEQTREFEKSRAINLTLAGFSFTSLGLLIGLFKDTIGSHERLFFFFIFALVFFVISFLLTRFRTRWLFAFLLDCFTDSGLWCILFGLLLFVLKISLSKRIQFLLLSALAVFAICLIANLCFIVKYFRSIKIGVHNGK
jgi:hypothetical protein